MSTSRQRLRLQILALRSAGCDFIYEDVAGGSHLDRPGLEDALLACRAGDALVVWRLDRLTRRQQHVGQILDFLQSVHANFRILDGIGAGIDASVPEGRALLGILAGFAEYQWEFIRSSSIAGKNASSEFWERISLRHGHGPKHIAVPASALKRRRGVH